jgi:hypothetical protein
MELNQKFINGFVKQACARGLGYAEIENLVKTAHNVRQRLPYLVGGGLLGYGLTAGGTKIKQMLRDETGDAANSELSRNAIIGGLAGAGFGYGFSEPLSRLLKIKQHAADTAALNYAKIKNAKPRGARGEEVLRSLAPTPTTELPADVRALLRREPLPGPSLSPEEYAEMRSNLARMLRKLRPSQIGKSKNQEFLAVLKGGGAHAPPPLEL